MNKAFRPQSIDHPRPHCARSRSLGILAFHDIRNMSTWREELAVKMGPERRVGRAALLAWRLVARELGITRSMLDRALARTYDARYEASVTVAATALRSVTDDESGRAHARVFFEALEPALRSEHRGSVALGVRQWPPQFEAADRRAWLGIDESDLRALKAEDAARILRALDGTVIGGVAIRFDVEPEDVDLPRVKGSSRTWTAKRSTKRSWLETVDDESVYSLTPRWLAKKHAVLLRPEDGLVIDAFAGVGGNAIEFAAAEKSVLAIEHNPERLAAARRNAQRHGVSSRIDFVLGDCLPTLSARMQDVSRAVLFLDPPWGGREWKNRELTWNALFEPGFERLVVAARAVICKLPSAFDLSTLPTNRAWKLSYEWSPDDSPSILKSITAWSY